MPKNNLSSSMIDISDDNIATNTHINVNITAIDFQCIYKILDDRNATQINQISCKLAQGHSIKP